jgi:hypothetical protein
MLRRGRANPNVAPSPGLLKRDPVAADQPDVTSVAHEIGEASRHQVQQPLDIDSRFGEHVTGFGEHAQPVVLARVRIEDRGVFYHVGHSTPRSPASPLATLVCYL